MKYTDEPSGINDINEYLPLYDSMKRVTKSGASTSRSYIYYFNMICLLAQTAYMWENLPAEIPNYYIEKTLFNQGSIGFSYDDVVQEYIALPCVTNGRGLDIYGEPKEIKLYSATNEYNKICTNNKDGFICYNNSLKQPSVHIALRYARRLQMIDDIIDINVKGQKTPYLIVCQDQKQLKTIKNILNKIDNNIDQIITAKDFTDSITTLDLKCEFKADKLIDTKRAIFNEACLYLGVAGAMPDKKERLINVEVENEEKKNDVYRQIGLIPRKYFCKKINEKYGLNVNCRYIIEDTIRKYEDLILNPKKEEEY